MYACSETAGLDELQAPLLHNPQFLRTRHLVPGFATNVAVTWSLPISQSSKTIRFLPVSPNSEFASAFIASSPITSPVVPSVTVPTTESRAVSKPSKDHHPVQAGVLAGILVVGSVVGALVVSLCWYYRVRHICHSQGHSRVQIHSQHTMASWTSEHAHETRNVEFGSGDLDPEKQQGKDAGTVDLVGSTTGATVNRTSVSVDMVSPDIRTHASESTICRSVDHLPEYHHWHWHRVD